MFNPKMMTHLTKPLGLSNPSGLVCLAGLMMAASPVAVSAATKPLASGELVSFAGTFNLSSIKPGTGATVSMDRLKESGSPAVKVDFPISEAYPGIEFPMPAGGWDLAGYGGVQADVTNPGTANVSVYLRVDNACEWTESPWSVEVLRLDPGETKPLKVVFGKSFGQNGFALDPAHVTSIRFFAGPVSAPFSVQIAGLRAVDPSATPASAAPAQPNGPTPYPDPKNEAAWPGKGPIRCFGWMVENRNYFWTQREQNQGAVVFVGDSLTGGWKGPMLAAAFPGLKIANRGVGGDTSRGVLFRFKEDVLDLKPRAIMLLVGGNDLSAHGDPAYAEENIAAMLDMVKAQDPSIPVILCQGPPSADPKAPFKPGARADLTARTAKVAAGRENVTVVNLFAIFGTPDGAPIPEFYAPDLVHLNGAGYKKWAEAVTPVFAKLGLK
ncbi:MAG: GDSL-type esterase/lipase family protein [Luteolibacter sp.]